MNPTGSSTITSISDDDRRIFEAYRQMLDAYLHSNHRRKIEIIEKAFRYARTAHRDMRRRNGDPYVLHPIAVARIAVEELEARIDFNMRRVASRCSGQFRLYPR